MPVALKLLTIIMAERLQVTLSARGLLAREQAGFRTREECMGQAAALMEVLMRRCRRASQSKEGGLRTFVMFVDLSKAYDTVPHEALMAKLHQLGVRGRMLAFIRALYESSEVRVRGCAGGVGPSFLLRRGVRQGCPLSPILFDIFINDLYGRPDAVKEEVGVDIPGVPEEKEGLLPGLLFADDLVAIDSTRHGIERQAGMIASWCHDWGMKVGIKKCGIMCVGEKEDQAAVREHERLRVCPIRMARQVQEKGRIVRTVMEQVPVVDEYTYLGVLVRRDLDLKAMAKGRLKKAERALGSIQPFLATQAIPLMMRAMVLKTVLMASVLHGAEIWGMSQERSRPAQVLVNKALRLLCGCKRSDKTVSVAAMWRELQVPPVHALASARRARASVKYPELMTWVATVLKYPMGDHVGAPGWAAGSRRWLKANVPELLREGDHSPKAAYNDVLEAVWKKMEQAKSNSAGMPYMERGFRQTSWAAVKAIPIGARREQICLGRGLRAVSMCRMGAFYTARKLARLGLVPRRYETQCPYCNQEGKGETIEHLLVG